MTIATLVVLIILLAVVLFAPRRYALFAMFTAIVFLSYRDSINIFGLRMYPLRFLEIAAFVRVMARREITGNNFGRLDLAVVLAYTYMTVVFLIRSMLGFGTSTDIAMVSTASKIGELIDVLLLYGAFRGLLCNADDLRWLLRRSVWLLLPFVLALVVERLTWRNPLAFLGAHSAIWVDANDGRIRCFGSFVHPALLGSFGAVMALSYVGLALARNTRAVGCIGFVLSVVVVVLANSGGPVTMLALGLVAWGCWVIRKHMRLLRFGIVVMLVMLAVVMKDPIWYLPSKMSLIFGGGGWHRSYLMNQAIVHVDQWWLAGMPLDLTKAWLPYLTLGAADITNLYLSFGIDGGLVALLLLIRLFVVGFSEVGKNLSVSRDKGTHSDELLLWGVGAALVGHAANFLSITYFDQITAVWLLQLAFIASSSGSRSVDPAPVVNASRLRRPGRGRIPRRFPANAQQRSSTRDVLQ